MNKLKAAIIGCGQIGATYDSPSSENILTHAHALTKHSGFDFIGFVDSNSKSLSKACKIWKCESFANLELLFLKHREVDVVIIATPDETHYHVFKDLLKYNVKLIFIEKPLARKAREAEELVKIASKTPMSILVNYSRRFVPEFFDIKNNIKNNQYGKYLSGNGLYGKGLVHNGSHMIDLIRFLVGEVRDVSASKKIYDFYEDDPSISASIELENNEIFTLNAVNCIGYTIFEMDLLFEKARIRIVDSGFKIEEYLVCESDVFSGYKKLQLSKNIKTSMGLALYNAVDNMYNNLMWNEPLKCTIRDGYRAIEVSEEITRSLS